MERNYTLQEVREAERAAYIRGTGHVACLTCEALTLALYPDAVPVAAEVALEAAGQLSIVSQP